MGPLNGDPLYKYVVVFICAMTRFVRLFTTANLSGPTFRLILTTYLCQHHPKSLVWDNHGQFNNSEIRSLLEDFKTTFETTTPYSHQENALVERAIGSIRRHFERWSLNHPNEPFSLFVPYAERIQNSQPIPGTTFTPIEVVYGTDTQTRFANPSSLDEHLAGVNRLQVKAVETHRAVLQKRRQEIDHLSARSSQPNLLPGQRILVRNFQKTKQISSQAWLGPFTVIRTEGNSVIVADLDNTGTTRPVHVKNIKLIDESLKMSTKPPRNFFEVESILAHRMNAQKNLVVTVKWLGYDEPSEENVGRNPSLRRTLPFVRYCRSNPELRQYVEDIEVFNDQPAHRDP
jgi:hypothetical protein